jgi:UDP-N-acetyl-D-glucosamine dehydrogenase
VTPLGALGSRLEERLKSRSATVGVVGLGYVGLPLAVAFAQAGFRVIGVDADPARTTLLAGGVSPVEDVATAFLAPLVKSGRLAIHSSADALGEADAIVICVPTPLGKSKEPDISFIVAAADAVTSVLRPGCLVVLESTTYPGTTDDVIKPILEETGLHSKTDFFLGFSPEREDPGNRSFEVATIPKVVAGDGMEAARLVQAFYQGVVKTVVPVSTTATAEAVKLTENIFRSVNIALVNELKVVLGAMGIDIWEVIEAAKSKPFGYMPFYPGPGLGGHCVPIDPFYLTWKAREYELPTRFIELAAEINTAMPRRVVDELAKALDRRCGKALSRSRILIIGLAYKKNVPDIRESPSLRLIELIEEWGGKAEFHDPHVTEIPTTREHMAIKGRRSVELTEAALKEFDAVVVATDHDTIDYQAIADHALLIVDTRNVFGRLGLARETVVKA